MTSLNNKDHKQELEIIRVISSLDVPEDIIRNSDIKGLIDGIKAEQKATAENVRKLDDRRKEKKDGNFVGNWWNDREESIQDAHAELSKSVGNLTKKSSQLLVINTAISKILNDQQHILIKQQEVLGRQADDLKEQNRKILDQQMVLEKQQKEINEANNGLLEAKGLTAATAKELIGCVNLVKQAENRIDEANQALRLSVGSYLNDAVEKLLARLDSGFAEQELRYGAFQRQFSDDFLTQSQNAQDELNQIASENAQFKSAIDQQLMSSAAAFDQHRNAFERNLTAEISIQYQRNQGEFVRFCSEVDAFKVNIERQLGLHVHSIHEKTSALDAASQDLHETIKDVMRLQEAGNQEQIQVIKTVGAQLQAVQQKNDTRNRLAIFFVAIVALASIGWNLAQYLSWLQ